MDELEGQEGEKCSQLQNRVRIGEQGAPRTGGQRSLADAWFQNCLIRRKEANLRGGMTLKS